MIMLLMLHYDDDDDDVVVHFEYHKTPANRQQPRL